jgi:putative tryptophan/tyrosine transport system substrate-binding protein
MRSRSVLLPVSAGRGGNATGFSSMNQELAAKQLGLLHELLPGAIQFAVLINSNNPTAETQSRNMQAAALAIGREIEILTAGTEGDIDRAFATLVQRGAAGLVITGDPLFVSRRSQLLTLATRHALPVIYPWREFAEAGGLMSYGSDVADLFLRAGIYTGRILKGERPADLPVQQAVKVELVLNLRTAKALGLTVSDKLLAVANEVIE